MTVVTLKDVVAQRIAGWAKSRIIRDYDEFCDGKPARRALLSYLVLPLLPPPSFRDRVKFSNRGIAQEIPRVLNELGYSVDIVNYDNRSWLPDRPYDLFIGHGGINFEQISRRLPERTARIYFSTGIYWGEFNVRVQRRAADLASRRDVALSPYRIVEYDEDYALRNSKASFARNLRAVETARPNAGINGFSGRWEDGGKGLRKVEAFPVFNRRGNLLKDSTYS
jgi:hypothetical protein